MSKTTSFIAVDPPHHRPLAPPPEELPPPKPDPELDEDDEEPEDRNDDLRWSSSSVYVGLVSGAVEWVVDAE
jgi:hypothetical protein